MLFALVVSRRPSSIFFFFNDTATTEIYTLSLHDALPILIYRDGGDSSSTQRSRSAARCPDEDRKSTRLNSSHQIISYAVFCLKKKKTDSIAKVKNNKKKANSNRSPHLRRRSRKSDSEPYR